MTVYDVFVDCIANKEVPILCISGEAVRKKE